MHKEFKYVDAEGEEIATVMKIDAEHVFPATKSGCAFLYHSTYAGEKKMSCPACNGKGKIVVAGEHGAPVPPKKKSVLREFLIALVDFLKFKLEGGK